MLEDVINKKKLLFSNSKKSRNISTPNENFIINNNPRMTSYAKHWLSVKEGM